MPSRKLRTEQTFDAGEGSREACGSTLNIQVGTRPVIWSPTVDGQQDLESRTIMIHIRIRSKLKIVVGTWPMVCLPVHGATTLG